MSKFRKRPVIVEAWRYEKGCENYTYQWPQWIIDAITKGIIFSENNDIFIKTKEGNMKVADGDWIIKEPFANDDRKYYPCKPDIFEKTYEPVES